MADLVRQRSYEDTRAVVSAEARRIFGQNLDVTNPRTPEGMMVDLVTATVHAHDRIANRVISELLLTQATGAFLDARGEEYNLRRRGATRSHGTVLFTGTAASSVPANTRITASNGVEFTTDFTAALDTNGEAVVTVTSTVTGIAANVSAERDTLSLNQTIAGVTAVEFTTPTATFVGGGEAESDEDYRQRLLQRSRAAVAGGNRSDWEGWVLSVPNVRAVRVYDPPQGGQVLVYVAALRSTANPNGIPTTDDLNDIRNRLEALRPIGARLTVLPVVAQLVNVEFANVIPNSEAVRTAMETAIRDYFTSTNQVGGTLYLKEIRDAANVSGLVDADLIAPTDSVDLGLRNIPVLNTLNVT